MVSWFGGYRYPKGIPAGLVAIAAGMLIAWGSTLFGFSYGGMSLADLIGAFANFGFSVPVPAVRPRVLRLRVPRHHPGHGHSVRHLRSGRSHGQRRERRGRGRCLSRPPSVLTADGVVSLIGCLMGNPFINAVYIGHPGWKAMGGRIGYSAATGLMVIVLSWFGIIAVMLSLIPVVAISPILLYIGMLIGAQAFQETPKQPCAGGRAGAGSAPRGLVQDPDGRSLDGGRHQRRRHRRRQARPGRRALSRARGARRRRDPRWLVLGAIGVFIIEKKFARRRRSRPPARC